MLPLALSKRISFLVLIAVTLAIAACYHNGLSGVFIFDDFPAIQSNQSIRDISRISDILTPPSTSGTTVNGRPLVNLTFALNYWAGGLEVNGYHVVNIIIHVLASMVLFGVAKRLYVRVWGDELGGELRALAAAGSLTLLWSLHPIQTQAVTYVVQRAESLVALFILLAIYSLCRARESGQLRLWGMVGVLACLFGVAAKEVIAAAPILVLLCDRGFYSKTFASAWRSARLFYVAIFATWVPLLISIILSQGRGGTVGFGIGGITVWSYALTQCDAIARYVFAAFFPARLVFDYGVGLAGGVAEVWWQGLLLVGTIFAAVYALLRWPRIGFVGAWFFLILAPSSSFVPIVTETMAEHRMYLPLAAILSLLVFTIFSAFGLRIHVVKFIIVISAAFGVVTFTRNIDYQTDVRLWRTSVLNYPKSARAHNNLGEIYSRNRRIDLALIHFQTAVEIQPMYLDALCNLSGALSQFGRIQEAITLIEGLAKRYPGVSTVQGTYGGILYRVGRREEAAECFRRALKLAPWDMDANNNYGVYLYEHGSSREALKYFETVLSMQPGDASALFNYANALVRLGDVGNGESMLRRTIQFDPRRHEAYNNLGVLLFQRGDIEGAIVQFRRSIEIAPEFADALNNLGVMLRERGDFMEAISLFERAILARSDYADARENLRRTLELEASRATGK